MQGSTARPTLCGAAVHAAAGRVYGLRRSHDHHCAAGGSHDHFVWNESLHQHCGHYHLPGGWPVQPTVRPVPVCDGSHCRNHHWRAGQACDQAQRTAGAGGLVSGGFCLGDIRRTHSGGVTEKRANKIICLRALCGACGLFCVRQPGFAIRRQIEYNIL